MSTFSNPNRRWLKAALLTVAMLAGCQAAPQPAPAPQVESAPAQASAEAQTVAPPPQPIDYNQQFYEQALAALKAGDSEAALALLTALSEDAPDKPRLFTNLGLAYLHQQQFELAEQAFLQAIEHDPEDAVAHNHLGILQRRQGHFQEALAQYQRAIEIDSGYARAHLNLGILFDLYLQDLEKALQQYQTYRSLTAGENNRVDGWIVDIERRLKSADSKSQG